MILGKDETTNTDRLRLILITNLFLERGYFKAEPFTIYKLTVLYMLDKAGFPLSNTQLSNFFLEHDYTDYFRVQEVIGNLVDADLILAESTHSNTQYTLTSAGKET